MLKEQIKNTQNEAEGKFCGISIPPDKRYEITSAVLPEIERLSGLLAKWEAIRFQGIDKPISVDEGLLNVKVHPNPEIFAQTILQMAYLEGGSQEMEKVYQAIEDRGVNIRHINIPFYFPIAGVATPELFWPPTSSYGTLVQTRVLRDYYPGATRIFTRSAEQLYQHELYHILQAARNPIYKKMVNLSCNLFLGSTLNSLPLAVGLIAGFPTLFFLKPTELEAYRKTGGLTDFEGTLTRDPSFINLKGKMFSFERVKK